MYQFPVGIGFPTKDPCIITNDPARKLANLLQLGRFVSVSALKHYFNVSNSYVVTKLRIILFPWWHRPWSRQQRHNPDPSGGASASSLYLPPREDINSPDMYIPTMA
jgi:hypothetical protein